MMTGYENGFRLLGTAILSAVLLFPTYGGAASQAGPSFMGRQLENAGAAGMPVVLAQVPASGTTTTTTTTHGGWTVSCTEGGDMPARVCSAEFRVVNKENQALVLIWLLGRNAEGQLLSEFVTPSNVMIKPGVSVTLDGEKATSAEYVYCTNNQGCRAAMDLPPRLIRSLRQAAKATIGIALSDGRPLEIGIELNGLGDVLTGLGA